MGSFKMLMENDFDTKLVDQDPSRQSFSWKVTYGPGKNELDALKKDLLSVTNTLKKLSKNAPEDSTLKELLTLARSLQNKTSRYLNKQATIDELNATPISSGPQIAVPLGMGPKKKKKPSGYTKFVKDI
jgi:hypothetical protein